MEAAAALGPTSAELLAEVAVIEAGAALLAVALALAGLVGPGGCVILALRLLHALPDHLNRQTHTIGQTDTYRWTVVVQRAEAGAEAGAEAVAAGVAEAGA